MHGGVRADAVYVTPEWDWKLGALEFATEFADLARSAPSQLPIKAAEDLLGAQYKSPELSKGDYQVRRARGRRR